MWRLKAEPAAIAEVIRLALIAAVGFGLLKWTVEQQAMLLALVSAVLSIFVRQSTTSEATLKAAGTSGDQVAAVAADPNKSLTVMHN